MPQTKIMERDPAAHLLPEIAEWDLMLAEVAYDYVRDAIRRGVRIGAAEINITPTLLTGVDNPAVTEWLADYTIRLAGRVNQTTADMVRDTLVQGIDAGEDLRKLTGRVQEAMGDEANKVRSKMIANTETARAERAGTERQMRDAGAVRKVWRTNDGACEFCTPLDGRTIEIDENFFSRGSSTPGNEREDGTTASMHLDYSDTPHPPLHPNCRCDTLYEFEEA